MNFGKANRLTPTNTRDKQEWMQGNILDTSQGTSCGSGRKIWLPKKVLENENVEEKRLRYLGYQNGRNRSRHPRTWLSPTASVEPKRPPSSRIISTRATFGIGYEVSEVLFSTELEVSSAPFSIWSLIHLRFAFSLLFRLSSLFREHLDFWVLSLFSLAEEFDVGRSKGFSH